MFVAELLGESGTFDMDYYWLVIRFYGVNICSRNVQYIDTSFCQNFDTISD